MASPPYSAGSPPALSPLALPSGPPKRPGLALPHGGVSSRKASIVSSTSSLHPLRQTSFPPPDSLERQHAIAEYSPVEDDGSIDFSDDNEIMSAISGPGTEVPDSGTKKRKRGEKRARGRPPKNPPSRRTGTSSLVNGDDARSTRKGAPTVVTADGADAAEGDDEDDGDDDQEGLVPGQGQMTMAEYQQEKNSKAIFRNNARVAHVDRFDTFNRVKLRTNDLRRIVNQTLSQSVPPNVVLVVSAYAKLFAGKIIEGAREVQDEWDAMKPDKPNGELNATYERLAKKRKREQQANTDSMDVDIKTTKRSRSNSLALKHESRSATPQSIQANGTNGVKRDGSTSRPVSSDGVAMGSSPHAPLKGSPAGSRPGSSGDQKPPPSSGETRPDSSDTLQASPGDKVEARVEDDDAGGAQGLSSLISSLDRGPLLADHLRESLRRYKRRRSAGNVGFTGLSLEGREVAAPRMGGRRLFR